LQVGNSLQDTPPAIFFTQTGRIEEATDGGDDASVSDLDKI
jgi:hypothetical protein